MNEEATQPTPTTRRRRQGRNGGVTAAQKAYASENDMGSVDASQYNVTPHTPEKYAVSGSPAKNNSRAKQRIKNKRTRQKNAASTSPEPDQPAQRTTPQRPASVKGPNNMAFAGATFHASPAPSALPMPSFFNRTTGGSPASKNAQGFVQQPSPPATDPDVPTPQRQSAGAKSSESPLDFMFRAHREERERQQQCHNHSAAHNATPTSNSLFGASDYPRASSLPHSRPVPARNVPSGGIDGYELNGNHGQPMGPAFATPYQERIKSARSTQDHQSPGQQGYQQQPAGGLDEDPTAALKKFLFSGSAQSPSGWSPTAPPARPDIRASPSAARPSEIRHDNPQGNDIQAMENDLRRILKLDGTAVTPNTERRLFTQ